MSGDQILSSRKADSKAVWEKKTLQYREWLKTQKSKKGEPLSDYFVRQSTVAIRSFFSFHRMELKFIPGERKRLGEAKPKTTDYRFNREDLKKMSDVADLEGKYVVVVGKKIPESAYVSEEGLRDGYIKAMAETCFTKIVTEAERKKMSKREALMVLLDMTEEDLRRIARSKKMPIPTIDEQIRLLEELRKEKQRTATNGGCQNGNCQRIVSEEELPSLLAQGWRVSAVLPSGKVVIESPRQ